MQNATTAEPEAPKQDGVATAEQLADLATRIDRLSASVEKLAVDRRNAFGFAKSLKFLFVLLASVALLSAALTWEIKRGRVEGEAIETLQLSNAAVRVVPNESLVCALLPGSPQSPPAVLRGCFGNDFFVRAEEVAIRFGANGNAGTVKAICSLHALERLRIYDHLTTQELRQILAAHDLKGFDATRARLDYGDIPELESNTLRWLSFAHTKFSDVAAKRLGTCKRLRFLNLDRTAVSDASIDSLAKLTELKVLYIQRSRITPEGARKLASKLPECLIYYQPLVMYGDGSVDARKCYMGSQVFGPAQNLQALGRISETRAPMGINQGRTFFQPITPY